MRKLNALLAAGLFALAPSAFAQDATQTVSLSILSFANIELADQNLAMEVDQAISNEAATASTYDISTSGAEDDGNAVNGDETQKITGVLSTDVTTGTLEVALGAPAGATSSGATALSSSAVDLVTGIGQVTEAGLSMDYTYTVPEGSAAGSQDVDVTYTITDA